MICRLCILPLVDAGQTLLEKSRKTHTKRKRYILLTQVLLSVDNQLLAQLFDHSKIAGGSISAVFALFIWRMNNLMQLNKGRQSLVSQSRKSIHT